MCVAEELALGKSFRVLVKKRQGIPKVRDYYHSGGPYTEDLNIWNLYWGSPVYGSSTARLLISQKNYTLSICIITNGGIASDSVRVTLVIAPENNSIDHPESSSLSLQVSGVRA